MDPTSFVRTDQYSHTARFRACLQSGRFDMNIKQKPKLAVWKFASCDGCQLSLLDLEDELLRLADAVELAEFREATSGAVEGPYDLALVTIGACATAGGVQALRNFADVGEFVAAVYASPDYISTLETSTPISSHV